MQIIFEIPEDLVRDAREFGILEEGIIIELLRQEVDQRVMALVNEEIYTYRGEERQTENPNTGS